MQKQEIGTIQGSKLGPRFFDDMNSIFFNDESVMYADDTTVAYVGSDLSELENRVNEILEQLIDWCRFNKLALNPSKCEYMLLTNKHVVHQPNIHLNGELLKKPIASIIWEYILMTK